MKAFLFIMRYARGLGHAAGFMVLFNVLVALFSLASLGVLFPVLQILFGTAPRVYNQVPWALTGDAIQNNIYFLVTRQIESQGEISALLMICLLGIAMFFFKNVFQYGALVSASTLYNGLVHNLRVAMHKQLLHAPITHVNDQRKGDLISRFSGDMQEIQWTVLTSIEAVVKAPLMIISSVAILIAMSPQLTLFLALVLPVTGLILPLIGKSLKRTATRAQGQLGHLISVLEEHLTGIRILKSFTAEQRAKETFADASRAYTRTHNRAMRKKDLASPLSEFFGASVMILILWYGGQLILVEKTLTGEGLITYLGFFYQIIPNVKQFSQGLFAIQKGNGAALRIIEVLQAPEEPYARAQALPVKGFERALAFENVSFSYADRQVLHGVNLSIPKGQIIALVGASGSGKTTMANLIPRFFEVHQGAITLDGTNINELDLLGLRGLMGMVTQESILFNDTAFNNIRLGKPNATAAEVEHAARIAHAHDFIATLPDGYHTNIGEGGNKLSGGQRQRLSIARAVLNDPPILILDEATSALDTESERLVQEALNKLMENRTSIVIAHRLSTIQHADMIVVMDQGRIIETGKHQELLNKDGVYAKLCAMQSFF